MQDNGCNNVFFPAPEVVVEEEVMEAPGALGIGILGMAMLMALVVTVIILDLATIHRHFAFMRRNLRVRTHNMWILVFCCTIPQSMTLIQRRNNVVCPVRCTRRVLLHMSCANYQMVTVDLVIFACLDFREFVLLTKFAKIGASRI